MIKHLLIMLLLLGQPTSHISMRQFWPIPTNSYAVFSCKLNPYYQTEYQTFVDDVAAFVVNVVVFSTYLSYLHEAVLAYPYNCVHSIFMQIEPILLN